MILLASLLVALVAPSFLVSKVMIMLRAKRHRLGWVLFAALVGSIFSAAALISLSLFVPTLDPMIMIIFSVIIVLFIPSSVFKVINQMNWGNAIATNVANVVVTLIMVIAAVVLNGESLKETFNVASEELQSRIGAISGVAPVEVSGSVEAVDQEKELAVKEIDFMTKAAAQAFEVKKTKEYVEPQFRVIKLSQARSVVGHSVRILNSHGNTTIGLLKGVRGGELVILKRISAGEAIVPMNISSVRKLEVYR